jgi:SRSO17 transposase
MVWIGSVGKQENCIVTVHLGYAAGDFHCLLDGDLFLPEDWSNDRDRCREAGVPDAVVYRPKTEIGLELYDRARQNGVYFEWLTFDEWYGAKPPFLRALDGRGQKFVGEVHKHYVAWIDPPRTTTRPYRRRRRGRGRKVPRLVAASRKAQHVEDLLKREPVLRDQSWEPWRVKDTEKGPVVWEVKHALIYPKDEEGLPDKPYHLVVARNVLNRDEIKYFLEVQPAKWQEVDGSDCCAFPEDLTRVGCPMRRSPHLMPYSPPSQIIASLKRTWGTSA